MVAQPLPSGIAGVLVPLSEAGRDVLGELLQEIGELRLLDLFQAAVGLDGDHAAADVDADGGGDNGRLGGDHRAHRGPDAEMRVGHEGHRTGQDRQAGQLHGLLDGDLVDVGGPASKVRIQLAHAAPLASELIVTVRWGLWCAATSNEPNGRAELVATETPLWFIT